ncbi:MAG TPA: hypothetical protein VMK83_00820 [Gaiellaceae bacterium]|nr:hypothetical protein [Gaiellaceae bacterium]
MVVGHGLGVADVELHGDTLVGGALAGRVDEHGREIQSDDVGAATRSKERHGAGAGRGVQNALAGLWIRALDNERMDVANRVRDALVRTVPPHDALARLELFEWHAIPSVGGESRIPRSER